MAPSLVIKRAPLLWPNNRTSSLSRVNKWGKNILAQRRPILRFLVRNRLQDVASRMSPPRRTTKPGRHLQAFIIRAYGAAVTEATAGGREGDRQQQNEPEESTRRCSGVVGWTNPDVFSTPRLIPSLSAICNCFVSAEDRGEGRIHPTTTATRQQIWARQSSLGMGLVIANSAMKRAVDTHEFTQPMRNIFVQ